MIAYSLTFQNIFYFQRPSFWIAEFRASYVLFVASFSCCFLSFRITPVAAVSPTLTPNHRPSHAPFLASIWHRPLIWQINHVCMNCGYGQATIHQVSHRGDYSHRGDLHPKKVIIIWGSIQFPLHQPLAFVCNSSFFGNMLTDYTQGSRAGETKGQHGLQFWTEVGFSPNSDTLACDPGCVILNFFFIFF